MNTTCTRAHCVHKNVNAYAPLWCLERNFPIFDVHVHVSVREGCRSSLRRHRRSTSECTVVCFRPLRGEATGGGTWDYHANAHAFVGFCQFFSRYSVHTCPHDLGTFSTAAKQWPSILRKIERKTYVHNPTKTDRVHTVYEYRTRSDGRVFTSHRTLFCQTRFDSANWRFFFFYR